jgi:DHA2 family multidrug resistance protein
MTSLAPDASFGYFAWARIYQVIGLPFLFIPITAVSYSDIPANKTNQGSALINVARNLGGSVGVSMATTILAQRAQFHQERLTEQLFPSSLPYQNALRSFEGYFTSQGFSPADAMQRAYRLIEQLVLQQAALMSYIDVFATLALVAAVMAPVALILLRRVELGAAPAAGH